MKYNMRKFLYTLLLLAMALPASGYGRYWADGICYNHLGNGKVEVIATSNGSYSGMMVIPRSVTLKTTSNVTGSYGDPIEMVCEVIAIADYAFDDCTSLTGIVLPSSIQRIGDNAFSNCSSLTSVSIANGVRSIGASAFSGCTALTSIVLPNSVTTLGWGAFYNCSSLVSVTLSKSLTALNATFPYCSSLTSIDIPSSVTALDGTFDGCTHLASVTMPKSLSSIGSRTFNECSALTAIDLPNSLTEIGWMAFSYTGLTSLELPETITALDTYAFYGCPSLTSVTVRAVTPPSMVDMSAFSSDTYGLASLLVPEISLSAYQAADWWNQFKSMMSDVALNTPYDFEAGGIYYSITGINTVSVTYKDLNYNSYHGTVAIPATVNHNGVTYTVTGIGNSAFRACPSLTGVTLPSSVTGIGEYAFYGNSGLSGIDFPAGLTTIGNSAFANCTGIMSLMIPAGVTTIGADAFAGVAVSSLTWNARACWTNGGMSTNNISRLTIGDGVTVLPANLASNSRITAVTLPESLVTIGDNAFASCGSISSLTIPVNVASIGENALEGIDVSSFTWNARECWTIGRKNFWSEYLNATQVTIGDEVEVLPSGFLLHSRVASVTIPDAVKTIGDYAFFECDSLTSFVIPDGVQNLGRCAFAYCNNIKSLVVGKGVKGMDEYALDGLYGLTSLTWNPKHCETCGSLNWLDKINQLTIGDEVEVIPQYFLYNSSIRSLEIPASVISIGQNAFFYHDSLESIVVNPANRVYDSRDNCNSIIKTANDSIVLTCKNSFLPNGITTIADYAFYQNHDLKSIDIPATVVSIGKYAFAECDSLVSMTIPDGVLTIGEGCFSECDMLKSVRLPNALTTISDALFIGCLKLEMIDIPNSVTAIGAGAFERCRSLVEVSLPEAVTTISSSVFRNCSNLKHVSITGSVTDIRSNAFENCTSLEQIVLPEGLTTIEYSAFRNCSTLTEIDIPNSVTSINSQAFSGCRGITELHIPARVRDISYDSFAYCTSLASITVDEGNIFYDSRDNCNAIISTASNTLLMGCKNTIIPNSVTTIGSYSFQGCTGLKKISIPNSVTTIGYDAFYGCSGLTSITIPASVQTINSYAFYNCTGITQVISLRTAPPTLNYRALETSYSRAVLRVPNEALAAYQTSENWKQFTRIVPFIGAGPGDVDGDGVINVQDVTSLTDMLLNGEELPPYIDVDGDGEVNVKDITELIDLLVNAD